jgi:hypothetical protein
MFARFSPALLTVALSAFAAGSLSAQPSPAAGEEIVSIGATFGGLSGLADLDAAGTADWALGWAASVDGTVWVHRYVGLRASGTWGQASMENASIVGRDKFNKFYYDANVVLRYPVALQGTSTSLIPYVLGGAGAVSYHQLDSDDTLTKFAGNFGAGLEYRFGRIGVRAEGRDFISKLGRFGFNRTQHDLVWGGGITVSF